MLANDVAAGGTRLGRTVSAVALAVAAVAGGVVLAFTMGGLREADLYRQRTGEGLLFAIVGTGLVVANTLLGTAAMVAFRRSTRQRSVTIRRGLLALAVAIAAVLATADVLAVWVASYGDRCVDACG